MLSIPSLLPLHQQDTSQQRRTACSAYGLEIWLQLHNDLSQLFNFDEANSYFCPDADTTSTFFPRQRRGFLCEMPPPRTSLDEDNPMSPTATWAKILNSPATILSESVFKLLDQMLRLVE